LSEDDDISSKNIIFSRLNILLIFRVFLELYKPLSQKLGYFNNKYEKQINIILNKIKNCVNNLNNCLKINIINEEIVEEKFFKIIKKYVKDKVNLEIVKVLSIEENLLYFGVDIFKYENMENKGFSKTRTIDDEVIYRIVSNTSPGLVFFNTPHRVGL